jgi:putative transcriptional regulator
VAYDDSIPCIFQSSKEARIMKNTLKVERAILNITQGDLASKIGVSRQTINSIESNRYVPSTVLSLKLSEVFNKPVNDFFKLGEDD